MYFSLFIVNSTLLKAPGKYTAMAFEASDQKKGRPKAALVVGGY
jgi:hypothetical protein